MAPQPDTARVIRESWEKNPTPRTFETPEEAEARRDRMDEADHDDTTQTMDTCNW